MHVAFLVQILCSSFNHYIVNIQPGKCLLKSHKHLQQAQGIDVILRMEPVLVTGLYFRFEKQLANCRCFGLCS